MEWLRFFKAIIVFMIAAFGQTSAGNGGRIQRSQAAVTSPAGLEDLYVRMKKECPTTYLDNGPCGNLYRNDYKESYSNSAWFEYSYRANKNLGKDREYDLEDKSEICFRIFSSGFFEWFDEEAVQFDLKATNTMKALAQKNPDIYNDIYQGWPNVPPNQWLNPIKPKRVSVGGKTFQEKVFTCLTRKRNSDPFTYMQYFVSPIYRSERVGNLMVGRFILTANENNELKLFAIAEEIAVVDKKILEETYKEYFDKRNYYNSFSSHLGSKPDLCSSSVAEKIRLCAIVLSATGFPDKVKFVPKPDHVEPICKKNKVWTTVKNREYSGGGFLQMSNVYEQEYRIEFEELMITCKGTPLGAHNSPTIPYYIARGLKSNSIILFKQDGNFYQPHFAVTNVQLTLGPGAIRSISAKRINSKFLY